MDRISCQKCDVVLPLVAIATPIEYTRNPLRVFELDFEENLRIIRYCVKYRKRVVFPSTSVTNTGFENIFAIHVDG